MKKQFALLATLITLAAPALASDWYDRYHNGHDGHWSYDDFKRANHDYYKAHKEERRLQDAELRAEFDRLSHDHPGYVSREEVREYHHW